MDINELKKLLETLVSKMNREVSGLKDTVSTRLFKRGTTREQFTIIDDIVGKQVCEVLYRSLIVYICLHLLAQDLVHVPFSRQVGHEW